MTTNQTFRSSGVVGVKYRGIFRLHPAPSLKLSGIQHSPQGMRVLFVRCSLLYLNNCENYRPG